MKDKRMFTTVLLAFGLIACLAKLVGAAPMGTAFTYQGFLMDDRLRPVNGLHDFWFSVYDNPTATAEPNRIAGPDAVSDVNVVRGYFRVELDFGSEVFTGDARWLETAVRKDASTDPCDVLRPRLRVTLSPYAIYADMAGAVLDGIVGAGTVDRLAKFIDTGTIGDSIIYEQSGKIGIGEPSPSQTLHVAGKVKIVDGSEGPEKVLTSDAGGVASWRPLPDWGIPRGVIVMWSGTIATIPVGWALCDGTNGTPDLRDRFVVGASQDDGGVAKTTVKGSLTKTGGEHEHRLTTAEMPSHTHSIRYKSHGFGTPGSDILAATVSGDVFYQDTGGTGEGAAHESCPPFYALAFILKL